MEFPAYAIIDTLAIKAIRHADGSVEVLRYLPKEDAFERDMRFLGEFYIPSPNMAVERVSEGEFEEYLAHLRAVHSSKECG